MIKASVIVLFAMSVCQLSQAGVNVPRVSLDVPIDSRVVISTAEDPSTPSDVIAAAGNLHPGWFLVSNRGSKAIRTIITSWNYRTADGNFVKRTFNLDGFLVAPANDLVPANHSALVSVTGIIPDSSFAESAAGQKFNSSFDTPGRVPTSEITDVTVHVDAIIFSDGEIIGSDVGHYEQSITTRYQAIHSVLSDVNDQVTKGQALGQSSQAKRAILTDLSLKEQSTKGDLANERRTVIQRMLSSSDIEAKLQYFKQFPSAPQFYNRGGSTR